MVEQPCCSERYTNASPSFIYILKCGPLIFKFLFFNSNKKMIEILTKISAKITIIVIGNKEPYYFIIICISKEVSLSLLSYQMLASTFDYQ